MAAAIRKDECVNPTVSTSTLYRSLCKAICCKSSKDLGVLLKKRKYNSDLLKTLYNFPLTHMVTRTGDVACGKLLIEHGFTFVWPGYGEPALHSAVRYGHIPFIEFMLDQGFNIDTKNPINDNKTPLLIAIQCNKTDAALMLIQRGCNIHLTDTGCHWSALHYAVKSDNFAVANKLLDSGADPLLGSSVNPNGRPIRAPLEMAIRGSHSKLTRLMVEKCNITQVPVEWIDTSAPREVLVQMLNVLIHARFDITKERRHKKIRHANDEQRGCQ